MELRVRLDEILPAKEAARTLPKALDRLDSGDAPHLVITRRNHPRAVLITIERYEELLRSDSPSSSPRARAA
jgi:PHD/YefM family antitoxin component YafN of YafNO toxin-antitoxin module